MTLTKVESCIQNQNLQVIPPVGEVHTIKGSSAIIRVLEKAGMVESMNLWYRLAGGDEWLATPMLQETESKGQSIWQGTAQLESDNAVEYGVQVLLKNSDGRWLWSDNTDGSAPLETGVLIRAPVDVAVKTLELGDLFHDIDTGIHVVDAGNGVLRVQARGIAGESTKNLGSPVDLVRYLSWVRAQPYWIMPRTGANGQFELDFKGTGLAFLRKDGYHVAVLPLSGKSDNCTTYLQSTGDGKTVKVLGQNDSGKDQDSAIDLLVAYGHDLEHVLTRVFDVSKTIIHGDKEYEGSDLAISEKIETELSSKVPKKWLPYWYDGFIYCTWNSLGLNMTHDKIINALGDLHDTGVRVSGIIIDDGWQSTSGDRMLYDFEAKEGDFPTGLKGLVTDIRKKFPYIENIGVWSTIVGYWNGFIPDSKVDKLFKTIDVPYEREGKTIRIPRPDQAEKFYQTYFSFLADCGITCVKIDNQATLERILEPELRGQFWQVFHDQLWKAAVQYFDGRIIYCMAMLPDIMLYSLQRNVPKSLIPVIRNSDDFYPNDFNSHLWHQYTNLYSSVYTRNLNALPDYDMFQTKLSNDDEMLKRFTRLHAIVRSISGGPMYFTDTPGLHDVELLKSFSARDSSGRDMVLRLDSVAKVSSPYKAFGSKGLTLATNYYLDDFGVLGVLNLSTEKASDVVTIDSFEFGPKAHKYAPEQYALRSYTSGKIWKIADEPEYLVSLESGEADIITASPFLPIKSGSNAKIALFGLSGNMSGVAGISSFSFEIEEKGVAVFIYLKAYGQLALSTTFTVHDSIVATAVDENGNKRKMQKSQKNEQLLFDFDHSAALSVNARSLIKVKIFLPTNSSVLL